MVPGTAASAPPGDWLEMWIIRHEHRPTKLLEAAGMFYQVLQDILIRKFNNC